MLNVRSEVSECYMKAHLSALRAEVEVALASCLPATDVAPERLHGAARHALLGEAKRVRAMLAVTTASHFGVAPQAAMAPAVAVELIHAASLVFDDLPSMDDADTRRGRPTAHVVYGEATAILAGILLLNRGFEVMTETPNLPCEAQTRLVRILGQSIGSAGLVAGQELDIHPETAADLSVVPVPAVDPASSARASVLSHHAGVATAAAAKAASGPQAVERPNIGQNAPLTGARCIHAMKTGALFAAACEGGATAAGATPVQCRQMFDFGMALGLAFQTFDDLLDVAAAHGAAGKDTGKDVGKLTMVSEYGFEVARQSAFDEIDAAMEQLPPGVAADGALAAYVQGLSSMLDQRTRIPSERV